jgi:hypothetical protein
MKFVFIVYMHVYLINRMINLKDIIVIFHSPSLIKVYSVPANRM